MQDEKRPLVMELAYILHRRNEIEVRRRRAKSKISYYEDIKRAVKEYKSLNSKINELRRTFKVHQFNGETEQSSAVLGLIETYTIKLKSVESRKSKPFKFLDKGSELNKRILKHRAEYMKARYDAARLTCSTRKRVARLTSLLKCNIDYQMGTGFVQAIVFKDRGIERISHEQFANMAREVEANKAIEKVLRSPVEKEEEIN